MMELLHQVEKLSRAYVRKGGKDNRRQQRARMMAFAKHAAGLGAREIGQVGARHVISYWKASEGLSDATRYSHWLAIRELWRSANKVEEPPRPRIKAALPEGPAQSFAPDPAMLLRSQHGIDQQ